MADKQDYQLQDGISKVHRSGLVLEGDDTIEAYPDIMTDHDDVLEPVASDDDADEDDQEDDDE